MFSLMFTLIFGLFFGRENNMAGSVAIVNKSDTELAHNLSQGLIDSKIFNIKESDNIDDARTQVEKSKISAAVYIPENFGNVADPNSPKSIKMYYDPGSGQAVTILSNFIDRYLTGTSFAVQNAKPGFISFMVMYMGIYGF